MKKSALLKITVFLTVFALALAPALFLILESDHDCSGADCDVCKTVAVCRGMLKLSACFAAALSALFALRAAGFALLRAYHRRPWITPVRLKVKLLN